LTKPDNPDDTGFSHCGATRQSAQSFIAIVICRRRWVIRCVVASFVVVEKTLKEILVSKKESTVMIKMYPIFIAIV
jgi:hypothetical protein